MMGSLIFHEIGHPETPLPERQIENLEDNFDD